MEKVSNIGISIRDLLCYRYKDLSVERFSVIDSTRLRESTAERIVPYASAESVTIDGSSCHRELPNDVQTHFGEYQTQRPFVAEVRDGVLNETNTLLSSEGEIILHTIGDYRNILDKKVRMLHPFLNHKPDVEQKINHEVSSASLIRSTVSGQFDTMLPTPEEELDIGFPLLGHYNKDRNNFFRWVVEFLPQIRALETYQETLDKEIPIIVQQDPPEYITEYLSLIGLADQILELPAPTVCINKMIVPPIRLRRRHDVNPSTDMKWVSERWKKEVSIDKSTSNNRIYVSRNDTDRRRIINEDELMDNLQEYGFEKHLLKDYNAREEVELMANAEIIVGIHGAGLATSIFAEDALVFDIFPGSFTYFDYYCLSHQTNCSYDYHLVDNYELFEDMVVDVDSISQKVKNHIENT